MEKRYPASIAELCELLLAYDPTNEGTRWRYATSLRTIGRWSEAEFILLALDSVPTPKQWQIEVALGQIYSAEGKFSQAEERFRQATESNPASTTPWVFLGGILDKQGRYVEAIDAFGAGLAASGDIDEVHLNMGHTFRAMKEYEAAVTHYERASTIDSEDEDVRNALSDMRMAISVRAEVLALGVKPHFSLANLGNQA
jgi:tetratricopeptide (TPR) repeat protein